MTIIELGADDLGSGLRSYKARFFVGINMQQYETDSFIGMLSDAIDQLKAINQRDEPVSVHHRNLTDKEVAASMAIFDDYSETTMVEVRYR